MRKVIVSGIAMLVLFAVSVSAQDTAPAATTAPAAPAQSTAKKFYIYRDKDAGENHFIPSGWMGDVNDLKINTQSSESPFSGTTAIQITYTAKKSNNQGWAGVYWQSSQNNWGATQTGYDLSEFNKLVFMAKGKNGGEVISKIKVGGITQAGNQPVAYPDTANAEDGPFSLTKDWKEYSVNLTGQNLTYINGGLSLVFNADQAKGEQTIYLDDIYFIKDPTLTAAPKGVEFPFVVYQDSSSLKNHFIPSGWMPGTAGKDVKMDIACKDKPFSGDTCVKVEYKNVSGSRWAGVYWQNPAGNWGTVKGGGYNLTGSTKLTFMARGETGNEMINEFKMGGMSSGDYPDSDSASTTPTQLTKEWKKFEIDLRGKDLSHVIGGFCWATNIDINNPDGIVFYLDDIQYEKE